MFLALRFTVFALLLLPFTTLAADPPEEVAKLIAQLKDPNEGVRLKAAKELGKLKDKALPAADALAKVSASDPDEDVRVIAKKALASIRESAAEIDKEKDKEIVAPFVKALKSKKAAERTSALEELTKLGERGRPASVAIVEAMTDASPTVRESAAACLEKVDPTLHKHVVSVLYDTSERQKATAVAELGTLGARAKAAVPILKQHYSTNSTRGRGPDTRTLASLVAIAPDDALIVSEVLQIISSPNSGFAREDGLQMLDSIDAPKKKKVETLIAALTDARTRVEVIEKLARFGTDAKPALPALMKLKLDGSAKVREAATKAIETIKVE